MYNNKINSTLVLFLLLFSATVLSISDFYVWAQDDEEEEEQPEEEEEEQGSEEEAPPEEEATDTSGDFSGGETLDNSNPFTDAGFTGEPQQAPQPTQPMPQPPLLQPQQQLQPIINYTPPPPPLQQQPVMIDPNQRIPLYFDIQCNCTTTTPPTPVSPYPIVDLTNDQDYNFPPPQMPQPIITEPPPTPPQPAIIPQPIQAPVPEPQISQEIIQVQQQQVPEPVKQQQDPVYKQIVIKNILENFKTTGQETDPTFTNYFHSRNMFDNVVNESSFWSQKGQASSTTQLSEPLNNYEICEVEIMAYNPQNVPFSLMLYNGNQTADVRGTLDTESKQIILNQCLQGVSQIGIAVNAPSTTLSIAEIKLFGNKLEEGKIISPNINTEPQETPTNSNTNGYVNITIPASITTASK